MIDAYRSESAGVRVDNTNSAFSTAAPAPVAVDDDDDNHENDENDDLQQLIYLARLPFCRATNTFVHPIGAEAAAAAAAQPLPAIGTAHPAIADITTNVRVNPSLSPDDDDPDPSDAAAAPPPPAAHNHRPENDRPEEEEEEKGEEDDASMADDGSDGADTTIADEEEENCAPSPAAGASLSSAAAAGVGRRPASVVREENRRFVAAYFVRADADRVGCSRCQVCSKHVVRGADTIRNLLRHVVTTSCLFRRIETTADAEDPRQQGAFASPRRMKARTHGTISCQNHELIDAMRKLRESYFDPPAVVRTAASAAAGSAGAPAALAADAAAPWRCRHCAARIVGNNQNQRYFQHVATCVGIVPLLQTLTATLRDFVPSSSAASSSSSQRPLPPTSLDERGTSDEANALPLRDPASRAWDELDDAKEHDVVACEGVPMVDSEGADVGPPDSPMPAAQFCREREVIDEENRRFVASNFVPVGAAESRKALACTMCDRRFARRDGYNLLRHAVSKSCLARRVEHRSRRPGELEAEACSADGTTARIDIGPSKVLTVNLHCGAVKSALRSYRDEHFHPLALSLSLHSGECKHCGAKVDAVSGSNQEFFYHLVVCTGIGPVIRALEGILRTFGTAETS
jgi:hypothetical protein